MTTTLWDTSPRHASKTLRYLYNKALLMAGSPVIVGEKEYPAYRLHDLLHDIACNLLITRMPQGLGFALPEAHAVLLERCKQRTQNGLWHTLADDGYIHSFLTWHMTRAGQEAQIHAVLREETAEGRSGWFQARERLDQTAGFLEDVNLAWKLAEQEQHIGLQCRYALIISTFKSLARNIPADLLIALVKHGVWSPAQGLAYARQMSDPKKRVDVFGDLSPFLPRMLRDTILHEALTTAQAIQVEWRRAKALTGLAPHLPDGLLHEALSAVQAIQNYDDRIKALTGLAPHLPDVLLHEALTAAQAIQDGDYRLMALTVLAPHLPDALLHDALTTVQAIRDDYYRAWALTWLAPHLPDALRMTVLHEALTAAQMIQEEDDRAKALTGLAPHLPLQKALSVVQEILDDDDWVKALVGLAQRLVELPVSELLPLWQDFLRRSAQRSRADLLSDLRALTPVIAKLGGEEGIVELFHAIQDVGRWWP